MTSRLMFGAIKVQLLQVWQVNAGFLGFVDSRWQLAPP